MFQTHGYREFVRVGAPTGKAIAELHGAGLAAARAEALGHIRAYPRNIPALSPAVLTVAMPNVTRCQDVIPGAAVSRT
jgi:hypothetical protein